MKQRIVQIGNTAGDVVVQLEENECEAVVTRQLNGVWSLSIKYPQPLLRALDKSIYFVDDGFLYVRNTLDVNDYITFIITDIQEDRRPDGGITYTITADHHSIITLSREIIDTKLEFRQTTPTKILSKIVPYSSYVAGTVTPTAKIDLTIEYETVLSALQKLVQACGCYIDVLESPRTIKILTAVGTDRLVKITPEINMRYLQRVNHSTEIRNRVYGVGGGDPLVNIGGAPHRVLSTSGTGPTILTCEKNKIVPADDIWNTTYAIKMLTGALAGNFYQITDCARGGTNDTITCAENLSTVTKGDLFSIVNNINHLDINYLFLSSGTKETLFQDSQWAQPHINMLKTPAFDGTYTTGLCEDWTLEGAPDKAENTTDTYIQFGDKSQRIYNAPSATGIKQTITHNQSGQVWSFLVNVYVVSGSVMLALQNGLNGFAIVTVSTGWNTLVLENIPVSASTLTLYILSATTNSEFYVDSVQAAIQPLAGRFSNPSDKKSLWDFAYDYLQRVSTGRVTYSCQFMDLYRLNPALYPFYRVELGDTITVIDDDLNINAALKIIEQRDIIFQPEKMESVISNE